MNEIIAKLKDRNVPILLDLMTGRIELETVDFSLPGLFEQLQSMLQPLADERRGRGVGGTADERRREPVDGLTQRARAQLHAGHFRVLAGEEKKRVYAVQADVAQASAARRAYPSSITGSSCR